VPQVYQKLICLSARQGGHFEVNWLCKCGRIVFVVVCDVLVADWSTISG